ncbi:hypothetical protein ACH5RR_024260 [Cinchona calisaya]|uniref:Sodium/calcium exchanger membrane region domain-containing protein n=1 Tax=Cinchona calisaya TaxID=153742 RepID=A0ABD2YW62_9GENT
MVTCDRNLLGEGMPEAISYPVKLLGSTIDVGGILSATFGNGTEMIISIYALKNGMIRVVQQSLLDSVLSNMLLVLGCAFLCGGIVHHQKDQEFNKATALVNSGLLLMAVMGLLFPAVLHFTHTELHCGKSVLALSRFSSCIMLVAYASYIFFQLRSHRNLYDTIDSERENNAECSDEEEAPEITQWEAIGWLAILTLWIFILSGYLVDAMQIPFCVVVGWFMGQRMDLNFQLFETATLFITVLVVAFMLQEGTLLILCYLIVAASFFVHVDPAYDDD